MCISKLPLSVSTTLASFALAGLFSVACSSSPVESPPVTIGADAQAPQDAAPAAPGRSAACVEQDTLVADVLAAQRKSPVLAVAVTNEACKTSVSVAAEGAVPAANALYRVGSVTKTYVSATVLVLAREGKVSLTDSVSKYVEGFPVLETITVEQLLHHTSGIFNFTEDPEFGSLRKVKRTPREIVTAALAKPVYFEPGKGFHYSNTNFTLLGMVVEKASGQKVSLAMRERVLVPAKLERTFLDGEETLPEALVPGFDTKNRDVTNAEDPSEPWTAGAMVASIGDVSRYHHLLFGGGLLDATSQVALTANPAAMDSRTGYGLAVFILDDKSSGGFGPALGHGGDIEGFHTQSLHYTSRKTTISAVVTQDGVDPSLVVLNVARALFNR